MSIVLFSNTVNNFNKIGGKFTLNNFDDDDAAANNKFGARKDTCHRDWQAEFNSQAAQDGRREQTPASVQKHTTAHAHTYIHMDT